MPSLMRPSSVPVRIGHDDIPKHPLERLYPLHVNAELRRNTFSSWPKHDIISADILCDNGFYYLGMQDKVQCAFCGGPLNNKYSLYSDRLASYQNWPKQIKQKPEDLAATGLYYKGTADKCQCYMCGGILSGWESEDVPKLEHKKWFPKYPLVNG